jgi:hypothetical protein
MTVAAQPLMLQIHRVPNPKFDGLAALFFELRIRKDTVKSMILVWFRFKSSLAGRAARVKRTFEPPHDNVPAFFKVSETMP